MSEHPPYARGACLHTNGLPDAASACLAWAIHKARLVESMSPANIAEHDAIMAEVRKAERHIDEWAMWWLGKYKGDGK